MSGSFLLSEVLFPFVVGFLLQTLFRRTQTLQQQHDRLLDRIRAIEAAQASDATKHW